MKLQTNLFTLTVKAKNQQNDITYTTVSVLTSKMTKKYISNKQAQQRSYQKQTDKTHKQINRRKDKTNKLIKKQTNKQNKQINTRMYKLLGVLK